jgi:hypothetical protein
MVLIQRILRWLNLPWGAETPAATGSGSAAQTGGPPASETLTETQTDVRAETKDSADAEAEAVVAELAQLQDLLEEGVKAGRPTTKEAQEVLARLLGLLPEIRSYGDRYIAASATEAARALLAPEPRVALGKELQRDLRQRFYASPANRVIVGVILFSALAIALAILAVPFIKDKDVLGVRTEAFKALVTAGAVGSLVSLLTRLDEYKDRKYTTYRTLAMESFLRPFVGIAFALFLYTVMTSRIVAMITVPSPSADIYVPFWLAIGFVAGFSERLGKAVVAKAEGVLAPAETAEDDTTKAKARRTTRSVRRQPIPTGELPPASRRGNNPVPM